MIEDACNALKREKTERAREREWFLRQESTLNEQLAQFQFGEAPPLDVVGCDGNREELVGCDSGGGGEVQQDGETGEETAKSPPESANVVDIVVQGYLAAQGPRPRSSPPPPAPSTSSLSSTSPTPSPRRTPPTSGSVSLRADPVPVTLPLALLADASQPPPLPAPGGVAAVVHGGTRPSL